MEKQNNIEMEVNKKELFKANAKKFMKNAGKAGLLILGGVVVGKLLGSDCICAIGEEISDNLDVVADVVSDTV